MSSNSKTMTYFGFLSFLFAAVLLHGCASTPGPTGPTVYASGPRGIPANAAITFANGDSSVGEYVSSWNGFRTSSYWIEGPTGLVLIDTQFLLSATEEFVSWAEKATGKKAVLAVVLHPNPDKFNGTALLQKRGIRVVTSEQVLEKIPEVHKLRFGWFFKRFQPDYPKDEPKPESFGSKSTELDAAGLKLKLHVLGAGCSDAHVAVQFKDHLFTGDLVTQGFHSWLELGLLDEWLKRLGELRALKPKLVHTGRGGSGDAELLDKQEHYLRTVIYEVGKHHPFKGKSLPSPLEKKIVVDIREKFPAYDFPAFLRIGPLWNRLGTHRRGFVD